MNGKYRITSALAALIVLGLAVLSKFYHGPGHVFANAYIGDIGIVIVLFFILSLFLTRTTSYIKIIIIAIIAVSVELFQATGIPASLHLPVPFVWVLGSSYDPHDFFYYAIGLALAFILDIFLKRNTRE